MNTRTGRVLVAVVVAVALAGCSSGPSQEEIMASNTEVRAETRRLVDEAVEVLLIATADLAPEEITGGIQESWSACGDDPFGPADPPESINWAYERAFVTAPDVDTAARVHEVAPAFLDRGWAQRQGTLNDFQRIERLGNDDGYFLSLTGQAADDEMPPALYVTVRSPCVPTPPDLEW